MSGGRRGATPIVSRAYRDTPDVCVRALTLLLKSRHSEKAVEPAPEPDSCNDGAIVGNTEEVSHVGQRPDRPSEST
jgi:hypothetical protein